MRYAAEISQTSAVVSFAPETRVFPSAEKARDQISVTFGSSRKDLSLGGHVPDPDRRFRDRRRIGIDTGDGCHRRGQEPSIRRDGQRTLAITRQLEQCTGACPFPDPRPGAARSRRRW